MRLVQYLNEGTIEDDILKLRNECSDFLKEFNDRSRFFRGTKRSINSIDKLYPRDDRRPRDINVGVHEIYDDEFLKQHGWKARSNGVFTAGRPDDTRMYGTTYRFFAVNGYKYLYNPVIVDLFDYINPHGTDWAIDMAPTIVHNYHNSGLDKHPYCEVMWNCPKGYYLVSDNIMRNYYSLLFKGV